MILKTTKLITLLLFIFFIKQNAIAQADSLYKSSSTMNQKLYKIKTANGKVLIGNILDDNENGILLLTLEKKDKIRIPKYDIESMEEIDQKRIMDGVLKGESNFATRYAFTSNGLPMKKGDAYFHSVYFLLYDVEYAVSDHISVGAFTSFYGAPFLLNVKYSTEISNDVHLGAGVLAGPLLLFQPSAGGLIIPYSSLTFGNRRNNLTFTGGYPSFLSGGNSSGQLLFSIGALAGISRSSFFVFDSFLFNASNVNAFFLLPGIRVEGTKSSNAWTFHLGAFGGNGVLAPVPIPVITYAHAFD